jgi:ATP-dependent Lon protease
MEILRLPGYLEHEKLAIARRYLLPRQLGQCGLTPEDIDIDDDAILALVRERTREAGVRNLERQIAALCRKAARRRADETTRGPLRVRSADLGELLGAPTFMSREVVTDDRIGVATGLAWTEAGGTILSVEVALLPGTGRLTLTGHLGETMQESGKAALSYIRARSALFGLDTDFAERTDIHVHLPEGGVPKDGPSAGITLALAMVSALTGVPTSADVAMTGEITLRGVVLPVGGLAEKLMAAKRAAIGTVVVPEENWPQVRDLPQELTHGLRIVHVRNMDEVIEYGLDGRPGVPRVGPIELAQAH